MRDAESLTLIFSSALVATVNFVRKKRWKLTGENLELGTEESREKMSADDSLFWKTLKALALIWGVVSVFCKTLSPRRARFAWSLTRLIFEGTPDEMKAAASYYASLGDDEVSDLLYRTAHKLETGEE